MGTTVFATVSTPGPAGPTGPAGYSPTYIVAAGAPSNSIGNNGDMYIDSTNGNVYGPKVLGAWGAVVCNIKGSTGATGAQGPPGYSPVYWVQAGPPGASVGNNNDMYINATTSDVYGPKTSGAWGGIQCNIKGATGAQGPPGTAANPKGQWVSTTTYAQADEVTSGGNLYISLQANNTNNNPATSPTWWQPVGTGGAAQTPWLSNIDGGGFTLNNAGSVIITGNTNPTAPLSVTANANGLARLPFVNSNTGASSRMDILIQAKWGGGTGSVLIMGGSNNALGYGETAYIDTLGGKLLVNGTWTYFNCNVGIGMAPSLPLSVKAGTNQNFFVGTSGYTGGLAIHSINDAGSANVGLEFRAFPVVIDTMGGTFPSGIYSGVYDRPGLVVIEADQATVTANSRGPLVLVNNDQTNGNLCSILFATMIGSGAIYGNTQIAAQFVTHGSGYPVADLVFLTNNSGGGPAERMRLTSAGNVGIGGASPNAKVDIVAPSGDPNLGANSGILNLDASTGVQLSIGVNTSNSYGGWIQSKVTSNNGGVYPLYLQPMGGNVTIGTQVASLGALLDINLVGTIAAQTHMVRWGCNGSGLTFGLLTQDPVSYLSGAISLYFNGNPGTFISAAQKSYFMGGNVGIGTNSPGSKLTISGVNANQNSGPLFAISDTGIGDTLSIDNASGANGFRLITTGHNIEMQTGSNGYQIILVGATGRVGMGVASPNYKLDVAGDVNCSGAFRVNGAAISAGGIANKAVQGYNLNDVHSNGTGKPMFVMVSALVGSGGGYFQLRTDTANPPTTIASAATNASTTAGATLTCSAWVLPGHYYQAYTPGNVTPNTWTEWW